MGRSRRGIALFELVLTTIILMVIAGAVIQVLRLRGDAQHASWQRQAIMQELNNVLEHVCTLPWNAVSEDELSRWVEQRENSAKKRFAMRIVVQDAELPLPARKVTVIAEPRDGSSRLPSAMSLSMWRFAEPPRTSEAEAIP